MAMAKADWIVLPVNGGAMFYYIWNGLLLIICIALPIILMIASNGAQPTFMSCREMRARYGTPKKKPTDR
jgi:hypothetical protein